MIPYILTLSCPDRRGIVAEVTTFLSKYQGFIIESSQFGDPSTGIFFMRTLFYFEDETFLPEPFKKGFTPIAEHFGMQWNLRPQKAPPKTLILASKQPHCVNALLNKVHMGVLPLDLAAIVSNHDDLKQMANWYQVPFEKMTQESDILKLIDSQKIELVILARYMQILSKEFCDQMAGKIINIHHSFLPSFKGAKPYHQAFDHGVKLIGATAHYVTAALDEGPIIEQEVIRVNHNTSIQELVAMGQDVESTVLSRAVKWHVEARVFLNGSKTVVFR